MLIKGLAVARMRRELMIRPIAGCVGGVGQDIMIWRDVRQSCLERIEVLDKLMVGDDHDRVRVVELARQAPSAEQRTQRDDDRPRLGDRPVNFQKFQAVGQDGRDVIAFAHTRLEQGVGAPVHAPIEFTISQPLISEDHRQMIRAVAGVPCEDCAEIHHFSPIIEYKNL